MSCPSLKIAIVTPMCVVYKKVVDKKSWSVSATFPEQDQGKTFVENVEGNYNVRYS